MTDVGEGGGNGEREIRGTGRGKEVEGFLSLRRCVVTYEPYISKHTLHLCTVAIL